MLNSHRDNNNNNMRIIINSCFCFCQNLLLLLCLLQLTTTKTTCVSAFVSISPPLLQSRSHHPNTQKNMITDPLFVLSSSSSSVLRIKTFIRSSSRSLNNNNKNGDIEEQQQDTTTTTNRNDNIQWELFRKYHAKGTKNKNNITSWKGIWTTYNYIGDIQLETIASVNYIPIPLQEQQNEQEQQLESVTTTTTTSSTPPNSNNNDIYQEGIQQTHTIVTGAIVSDCATCFDSCSTKDFNVAMYSTPNDLMKKKSRLGGCGMVIGPSLLRNAVMATELVLSYGDGRIRVIYQHGPVWDKNTEPGMGPPQGLKLFRTLVSIETTRNNQPPQRDEQQIQQQQVQDGPIFFRPVPPFNWHKKWNGTSWTWGTQLGNQGWQLNELEDGDSWHGTAPVEVWNLRLPGGICLQCPRVIVTPPLTTQNSNNNDVNTDLFRLAWLPNDETLLRLEAGIVALQPMENQNDIESDVITFQPPSLISYRCDMLTKIGDLDGQPSFVQQQQQQNSKKSTTTNDEWQ